jgi:hypothetical protein
VTVTYTLLIDGAPTTLTAAMAATATQGSDLVNSVVVTQLQRAALRVTKTGNSGGGLGGVYVTMEYA